MESRYNGWTNYATWRVNLEVFDGSDMQWCATSAREHVEELVEDTTSPGLARDYALAFLSGVNWNEIADYYQSDYP